MKYSSEVQSLENKIRYLYYSKEHQDLSLMDRIEKALQIIDGFCSDIEKSSYNRGVNDCLKAIGTLKAS
jgi:hypothetical protein